MECLSNDRLLSAASSRFNNRKKTMKLPPADLPIYRVLTGPGDAKFCRRVSEVLALGYVLYGSPSVTFTGETASPIH